MQASLEHVNFKQMVEVLCHIWAGFYSSMNESEHVLETPITSTVTPRAGHLGVVVHGKSLHGHSIKLDVFSTI